jgi:branched-chain amino acid transport system permease protein
MTLFIEQCLNGLQFGLLLFLLAAGLTLVFGIMDLVNLAHGSLYMIGAYFAATFAAWTGSFVLGAVLALATTLLVGMAVEVIAMRRLYGRDHLDHVLGTFGLILFFDESVRLIWGPAGLSLPLPSWLNSPIEILPGVQYSAYKLSIILVSLVVAIFLYVLVMRTRRHASSRASGRDGGRTRRRYGRSIRWCLAGHCARGTTRMAPVRETEWAREYPHPRLRHHYRRIGSIRGALVAAILVGFIDTLGRAFFPDLLRLAFTKEVAATAAPALSSMLIYLLMAIVLIVKPEGLFSAGGK